MVPQAAPKQPIPETFQYGNGSSLSVRNFEVLSLIGCDGGSIWMDDEFVRNGTR